ncbi:MAG: hypothetical protein KY454_03790 [Actinobacteria bacterium]|nr:hypothetical protein [Actinomycetota bacterium]MBW3649617.1 hypothetical protein [Actinomycetota bacterium]
MLTAQQGEAVLTGWYVGYVIALVVISAVVVLVGMILGLARRIGVQAEEVVAALDEGRINTLPLWDVAKVNDSLRVTGEHAMAARTILEAGE